MRINGVELSLDLYDLETADRVQRALNGLSQELGVLERKDVDWCESLHGQMRAICRFFDAAFGKGTALCLFGRRQNLKSGYNAVNEFFRAFYEIRSQPAVS